MFPSDGLDLRRLRAWLVLAATIGSLLVAVPAAANFGSTGCGGTPRNCVSLANNRFHAVRFVNFGDQIPGLPAAVLWSLNQYSGATDLVAYRDDADPVPDVFLYDWDYGNNGFVAWVECPTNNSGTGGSHPLLWCRGQRARFNSNVNFSFDYAVEDRRQKVACHELGHTVGLRHFNQYHGSNASCTSDPASISGSRMIVGHESHEHINPWY